MKNVLAIAALAAAAGTVAAQPANFLDLGVIGGEGAYTFDTIGSFMTSSQSDMDTELGLWDNAGTLIDQDDDGAGFPFSLINANLTAGVYWLAISEFNSDFANGWVNNGTMFESGEFGDCVVNIDGVFAGSRVAGHPDTGNEPNAFFKVTVVPAPASMALLGLGGIAAIRRRR